MSAGGAASGTWLAVGPGGALAALRPLARAHEREREVRLLEVAEPGDADLGEALLDAGSVLLVGDRRRAPSTALPGPLLRDAAGRAVPAGWVPDVRPRLGTFARAAARTLRRDRGAPGPVAVLGQWQERYMHLAGRMEGLLAEVGDQEVFRWTAERVTRADLVPALRGGLGLALYFGHGRPGGWAAYHGLRARHLVEQRGEPLGAVTSVTCRTASRWGVGLSFCEEIVLGGAAAGAVGAVGEVAHLDSMRWMYGLADALREGETLLGPALARALPPDPEAQRPYRIVGDPLAPLAGTAAGAARAARLWAPAPEHAWT